MPHQPKPTPLPHGASPGWPPSAPQVSLLCCMLWVVCADTGTPGNQALAALVTPRAARHTARHSRHLSEKVADTPHSPAGLPQHGRRWHQATDTACAGHALCRVSRHNCCAPSVSVLPLTPPKHITTLHDHATFERVNESTLPTAINPNWNQLYCNQLYCNQPPTTVQWFSDSTAA